MSRVYRGDTSRALLPQARRAVVLPASEAWRLLVPCLGALALLAGAAAARRADARAAETAARADLTGLTGQYIKSSVENLRLQAQARWYDQEKDRLRAANAETFFPAVPSGDVKWRYHVASVLMESGRRIQACSRESLRKLQDDVQRLTSQWQSRREELNSRRQEFFEIEASSQMTGQLAFLASIDDRWFWLWGLVAIATLVGIVLHERRHEIRRLFNGGRARALLLSEFSVGVAALFALTTLTTFVFGDRIYNSLLRLSAAGTSPERQIGQEIEDLTAKALPNSRRQLKTAEQEYRQAMDDWKQRVLVAMPAYGIPLSQWEETQGQLAAVAVELAVQRDVSGHTVEDLDSLDKLRRQVDSVAAKRLFNCQRRQWFRGGLGLGMLGLTMVGTVFFHRGLRRRREAVRSVCPLCLGQGTFDAADDASAGGTHLAPGMVRCSRAMPEAPGGECGFTFLERYLDMPKLCFPTLGIPQAGKTHWLAMTYRDLSRGNYPDDVQFSKVESTSSEKFDKIVDEICNSRMNPEATQQGNIPYPLIFGFRDHDPLGASNLLVSIFDYSGEVSLSQTLESSERRRALEGEGFFFFLDPTAPDQEQAKSLARFREHICAIKGIAVGEVIRTPVALCVSKIDLMSSQLYADSDGGGIIDKFYDRLAKIGWQTNMKSIKARSDLVARLSNTIWPGWRITREITDLFGGRFMFFPLTPIGLEGARETDLANRVISPLGLLDPLLWLLHMNGYPVVF